MAVKVLCGCGWASLVAHWGTSRNSIGKGGHLLERPVTEPGPLAGLLRMETCGKRLLDVSFLVLRFLSVEL